MVRAGETTSATVTLSCQRLALFIMDLYVMQRHARFSTNVIILSTFPASVKGKCGACENDARLLMQVVDHAFDQCPFLDEGFGAMTGLMQDSYSR